MKWILIDVYNHWIGPPVIDIFKSEGSPILRATSFCQYRTTDQKEVVDEKINNHCEAMQIIRDARICYQW